MNHIKKWKISLYLAAIFFAGVVTGLFVSFQVVRHMMPRPDKMAARWCGELQSKLNLTPEQVRKIRPIIDDAMKQFGAGMTREVLLNLSNCNARIVLEITPEQKAKFETIEKEQHEFLRAKFGAEPPGSPQKQ